MKHYKTLEDKLKEIPEDRYKRIMEEAERLQEEYDNNEEEEGQEE